MVCCSYFVDVGCITTTGVKCIFPFTHEGKEYTQCTSVTHAKNKGTFWCATRLFLGEERKARNFGECAKWCHHENDGT